MSNILIVTQPVGRRFTKLPGFASDATEQLGRGERVHLEQEDVPSKIYLWKFTQLFNLNVGNVYTV